MQYECTAPDDFICQKDCSKCGYDEVRKPLQDISSALSAGLYCVGYCGVVRYFETEKAVAGFLWGKKLSKCKVFRQITGLPSEVSEIEKYLKAI